MVSFAEAIRVAIAIYGYERMAKEFSCSGPTADKWAAGESAPSKGLAKLILRGLEGLLSERKALIDLLSHPAGYGVQQSGYIFIRNLEDRTIAVCEEFENGRNDKPNDYEETIHESVEEAVDKFLNIRHRAEFGLDYEEEAWFLSRLDDLIDVWHEGESNLPLNEFMGLTSEQYNLFVSNPKKLAKEMIETNEPTIVEDKMNFIHQHYLEGERDDFHEFLLDAVHSENAGDYNLAGIEMAKDRLLTCNDNNCKLCRT